MKIFRGHGLGNDYLAADEDGLDFEPSPAAVRELCDRHTGVGSDGLLVRVPAESADFAVRIFNPDGSEAEKSGNGLRVFAAYLHHLGEVRQGRRFSVWTAGGVVTMEIVEESAERLIVDAEMGCASFRSGDVGLKGPDRLVDGEMLELDGGDRVTITTVSVGNPHCVVFEDEIDEEDVRRRGPQISTHPFFLRGTNVQFARAVEPGAVEAWVWERGAGETRASGSSACAVAAAAVRRGLVSERSIEVRMPGGALHVDVGEDWSLTLRGPVESVCTIELTPGMLKKLRIPNYELP